MFNKSTKDIISHCENAIKKYDRLCTGFLGKPGKEGIHRKQQFQTLINDLKKTNPPADEAFLQIYQFSQRQKATSRLNGIIFRMMMHFFNIPTPHITGNVYGDAGNMLLRYEQFHQAVITLKADMGIVNDNDIPLTTLGKNVIDDSIVMNNKRR